MTAERKKQLKADISHATTTIYAYIEHFSDNDLATLKPFIDDEIQRRIKAGGTK